MTTEDLRRTIDAIRHPPVDARTVSASAIRRASYRFIAELAESANDHRLRERARHLLVEIQVTRAFDMDI